MKDLTPSEKFEILSSIRTYMEREMEDVIKHTKPSPDTLRMFGEVNDRINDLKESDKEAHNLLFNEIQGIKKSNEEYRKLDEDFRQTIITFMNNFKSDFMKRQDAQDEILKPIKETYDWVRLTGVNGMKLLVFISVISGLIFGWFAFLKPFFRKIIGD